MKVKTFNIADIKTEQDLIALDVNARAEHGYTPLHLTDDPDTARVLIDAGADVNARDEHGNTPLHGLNDPDTARVLIDAGADVNAGNIFGNTPLHGLNDVDVVRALIAAGADVNARDDVLLSTPLHEVAKRGDAETARALLDAGADPNAIDHAGYSPLCIAHTPEIARVLIDAGADVNARDENGYTPLHYALISGNGEKTSALLDAGAEESAEDFKRKWSNGCETALAIARARKRLVEVLEPPPMVSSSPSRQRHRA